MYKKSSELVVGIFVLVGIACLIFLALKVSGLSASSFYNKSYNVHAEFKDIGSLTPNAAVRISGVQVGTVDGISLKSNYNGFIADVSLTLNNNYSKIPADYSASIQTSGILGASFIALTPSNSVIASLGTKDKYLHNGSLISIENTTSAMNLNNLISAFASGSKK